jgi:hypothetical protein
VSIWSWLFPSDEDLLRRARARMAAGRWVDARKLLVSCKAPEAEALYDECSRNVDKGEEASFKKRLKAEGFHGWKVEVDLKNARAKAEMERLVTEELQRAGVDMAMPEVDQTVFQKALGRAQRRAKVPSREAGAVKLVPMVDGELAKRLSR